VAEFSLQNLIDSFEDKASLLEKTGDLVNIENRIG
jgi:hypothetical protein